MDSPTSFSSVPPELVTKICRDPGFRKAELIALRLTSKSQGIHLSASKEFARRYFKNINLIYTRYSLQAFVEICKHPVYGSAVRKVQLSYARFVPDRFEEESKSWFKYNLFRRQSQGRHEFLDHVRLLINRCDEEESLTKSGDAEDLLAAAFAALSQWRHPLEIVVSSYEAYALGQGRTYTLDDLSESAHWECDILGTVNLLYHAAIREACVVKVLQVEGVVWDNLVDTSSASLSSLAQLSELKLNIWPAEDDSLRVAGLDDMAAKLLENAAHLASLHLEYDCTNDNGNYLREIFTAMSSMRLEKITLAWLDFDRSKPFENQIESLRHLELIGCDTNKGLKAILRSIQKNYPRLECFRLTRPWLSKEIEFRGAQEVNDGIEKMMHSRLDHKIP
ncbi:hypothetical protein KCU65_g2049, partial [Aureobasidium melanogenum]